MAVPAGIKLDDGTGYFLSKCFPARNILGSSDDGAWLVAHQVEQQKRLKAVLTIKESKTYSQIKHERREKGNAKDKSDDNVTPGLLDGFFLLKYCCVEDPNDLCNVNVSGQDLTDSKEEDFELFQNVAYVNAGENLLQFECFRGFSGLRQLELPLNGLRGLSVSFADFPSLECLDLSYNNLSKDDILALGVLPKLRILHLSGNQLRSLPSELQKHHVVSTSDSEKTLMPRFALLEELFLDDNQLSDLTTFASLAGLRRLKRLNLAKNKITAVPHLKAVSGKHVAVKSNTNSASSTPRKRRSKSGGSRSGTPDCAVNKSQGLASNSQAQLNDIEESLRNDLSFVSDLLAEENESLPPPFPELEYLNLAHNEVAYEENLLAVAAWPMLSQLDIYANPLTIHNKGDPPLLRRYLVERLGVQMMRQRPISGGKPTIQMTQIPHRKVEEIARPLPKRPLEMMLEPPPDSPAVLPPKEEPASQQLRPSSHPLPPIPPGTEARPKTDPGEGVWTRGQFSQSQMGYQDETKEEGPQYVNIEEPVFLTQVEEEEIPQGEPLPISSKKEGKRIDSAKYSMGVPEKFKGYEIFWDSPDDKEVVIQKDIQSNLRSLKLTLQHKPIFRGEVDLDRLQKPFQPHQKATFQPRPSHKTKAKKLEEVLEEMKKRATVTEENLGRILEDKERMQEEYPEVPALLKEIQAKYKAVRAESMKEKRQLVETKDVLLKTADGMKSTVRTTDT